MRLKRESEVSFYSLVSMRSWHWTSKVFVLIGVAYIVYCYIADVQILWEKDTEQKLVETFGLVKEYPPRFVQRSGDVVTRTLPPVEYFSAMLERPLFSPQRRMNKNSEINDEPILPEPPAFPLVRFVGTIEKGDNIQALIHGPDSVGLLSRGDEINGWRVSSIERRRLVLRLAEEVLDLEILSSSL